jgi:hypothetical protein
MYRCILALALVLPLSLVGCKKASTQGKQNEQDSAATPAVSATPAQEAVASPTPALAIDRSARVVVFCYHKFEDKPKDQLAIAPAEFKAESQ